MLRRAQGAQAAYCELPSLLSAMPSCSCVCWSAPLHVCQAGMAPLPMQGVLGRAVRASPYGVLSLGKQCHQHRMHE